MESARFRLLLVISLFGARVASAAVALDDIGGSLSLTNDDIYHGISQTCGDAAAQGDLHYRSAGGHSPYEVFAGIWGSAGLGQSNCGRARELNIYAGYGFPVSEDSSGTISYTHYGYPGGAYTIGPLAGFRYDYDTLEGQWAWQDQVYLSVGWTPDALRYWNHTVQRARSAYSYGLKLRQPLVGGLSAAAGLGYDETADPFGTGYGFWNAGLDYVRGAVQLQAAYFGTSSRAEHLFGSYVAGHRVSVSVIWRF